MAHAGRPRISRAALLRVRRRLRASFRSMRTLTDQDLHDIAAGSAVLGTGGGGDPYIGELAALRSLEQYGPPQLISVDDIDDADRVAIPFMIGSPVPLIEKFPLGK